MHDQPIRVGAMFIAFACFALLAPAPANEITILCDGVGGTVADGGPGDRDPDADEIEAHFTCAHAGGFWIADGRILATVDNDGNGDLIVTDTFIRKIKGVFINGEIDIRHTFDSVISAPVVAAEVDGEYDNVSAAGVIGFADVVFAFFGYDLFLGVVDPPAADSVPVPPPVPFAGAVGPVVIGAGGPPSEQVVMNFYLDTIGDAIRLHDSVHMRVTPEPASAVLCMLGAVLLRRRFTDRE